MRCIAIARLRVGLGDLLTSVPALRALRAARPEARVVMITWPEVNPVVRRMSAYVDELLAFPGYPGIPERPPRRELIPEFLEEARRRSFDLAIQMYGASPVANEVTSLLGARRAAGFVTPGAWNADPATHLTYPKRDHEVRRHLRLMEHLGAESRGESLEFPLTGEDRRRAELVRRDLGLRPRSYALLHPGATASSRRWPPDRFAQVADALSARGLRVLVAGVSGEEAATSAVVAAAKSSAIDVCGRFALGPFAALLASAALLVGNDSGPAHLAAALGTPSVTVFLAGDPARWSYPATGRHRAVTAAPPCQPCGQLECPIDFRCARDVGAKEVMTEADELLSATPPRGESPERRLTGGPR